MTKASYGEALRGLRGTAHVGVREAIEDARDISFPRRVRLSKKRNAGHEAQALFDGVVAAIAETVVFTSRPGRELEMAHMVAKLLISKVELMGCAGRC